MADATSIKVTVDRLDPIQAGVAFPLMKVLRPHLTEALFHQRLARQRALGYEFFVARDRTGEIVGVAGVREVCSFFHGEHLFVDDLVVDEKARGMGIGESLMAFCEADARRRGLISVLLNARPSATAFYDRIGFVPHTSPSMKKQLD